MAATAYPVLLTGRSRLPNVQHVEQVPKHIRVGLEAQLHSIARCAHEQYHRLGRLQRRRHLHQAPHAEEGAQQLGLIGHLLGERVDLVQLRHRLHVRAHQHEGLGRLHHRRKVEVLELLGRLRFRDAVLALPLQHREDLRAAAGASEGGVARAARQGQEGPRRTSIHT